MFWNNLLPNTIALSPSSLPCDFLLSLEMSPPLTILNFYSYCFLLSFLITMYLYSRLSLILHPMSNSVFFLWFIFGVNLKETVISHKIYIISSKLIFLPLVISTSKHSSVQYSSVALSCPTLCNTMHCSTPGFPVHHQLQELTQTHRTGDAIQPSHPLPSLSPPAFSLSWHLGVF